MGAFTRLKDKCQEFEQVLQQVSNELFSAKLEETFEDLVAKKMRDLSLFSAKSRFLRAKPLSLQPEISDRELDEKVTLSTYEDAVVQRVMEKYTVKATMQAQAVKSLLTTPDGNLDPEMLARKRKIIQTLTECSHLESMKLTAAKVLQEKEATLVELRLAWHDQVAELRAIREDARGLNEINTQGKYYEPLSSLVQKIEHMRWMITKLTTPRTIGYDWLRDPYARLQALKAARRPITVDTFVHEADASSS